MGKKKFKDTKIGIFLKEKAPHILDIVGDVLPDKGALGIIKNIIDKDETIDSETKSLIRTEVQAAIYNEVFNTHKNMKSIFTSKKFWYAIAGLIAMILAPHVGIPEDVLKETLGSIALIVTSLIIGQGLADFGKEKEKLK